MSSDNMPDYLTPDDVVSLVPGISRGLLSRLRFLGTGPKFLKPTPRTVLYRASDIFAWIEASEQSSTSESAK